MTFSYSFFFLLAEPITVIRSLICSIIILSLIKSSLNQDIDQDCNDGRGECKFINDCPPIAESFAEVFDTIKYCNRRTFLICCPKKTALPAKPMKEKDISKISVRECIAYSRRVYDKCEPQPLIVSGTAAEPREFPHMALLGEEKLPDRTIRWQCGGTLISPKWVISAAHCFYGNNVFLNRVRLGELDYSTSEDDAEPQDFTIKQYITHPEYNHEKNYNDIVLIELDREARLNKYVVPACLPLNNGTEYTEYIAAGWGATGNVANMSTYLQKVRVERFDDADCKELIDLPFKLDEGIHERTQLCAGSHSDKRDTCQGDSGGPLFVEHPAYICMYLLVGITSFGQACGIPGFPGVYVRVNLFVTWIENIVWNATASI